MKGIIIFSILISFFWACTSSTERSQNAEDFVLKEGMWKGVLKPQGIEIPFLFNVEGSGDSYSITLKNAEERMVLDEVVIKDDSLHVQLFVFDATIHAKIEDDKLHGIWVKNYAEDYEVPFEATFGNDQRFKIRSQKSETSFDGKWEVDFISDHGVDKVIGLFSQKGQKVTGTFLTPTGDYRYLEGVVDGNKMKLSCFDGCYAFLFEAEMLKNGEIAGELWSGKTRHQNWTAKRNDEFELPDPSAMKFLKKGYENFDFEFPNTSGDLIKLSDDQYKNKIIVISILGTWCPNCMDETSFFVDWYRKNKERGVEFIGLAFESKADEGYAASRINKFKEKLAVNYEVLIAGTTSKESRAKALPMVNKIMPFPTSIILDKQHKVRRIHMGFSGPGTRGYYEKYVEDFNLLMDKLVKE